MIAVRSYTPSIWSSWTTSFVFAPRTRTDYGFGWRRAVFHQ